MIYSNFPKNQVNITSRQSTVAQVTLTSSQYAHELIMVPSVAKPSTPHIVNMGGTESKLYKCFNRCTCTQQSINILTL